MIRPDGIYFAYLRKSREDQEAEARGSVEDTLARHEYIIRELAAGYGITVSAWYREVVSGETIVDRPKMQELLKDIETVRPDGVLVVEVERLSRGNPQDQGRVTDTFKYAGSKIITPVKIYDLQLENDEEWLDFGLMRSRMEYRTIKRRMQNGRTTSAMQGKYIGNVPPYGWQRKKLEHEKGFILEPCPETEWVLKLLYAMLDTGTAETDYLPVGPSKASQVLEKRGIPAPGGGRWTPGTVSRILRNPANAGMVRVGYRKQKKVMVDGEIVTSRPLNHDCLLVPARWDGMIGNEVYSRVKKKLEAKSPSPAFPALRSPLSGLVRCGICKRIMRRRPAGGKNKADTLQCRTCGCPTVGAYYSLVEERLLAALEYRLKDCRIQVVPVLPDDMEQDRMIRLRLKESLESSLSQLDRQLIKVHSCFEQDIYDLPTFQNRSQAIQNEMAAKKAELTQLELQLGTGEHTAPALQNAAPHFENILDSYRRSDDPVFKNTLLKQIVSYVEYKKDVKGGKSGENNDCFELDIHMKL